MSVTPSPSGPPGTPGPHRVDPVVWVSTVVLGAALGAVAVTLLVVGLFETSWPDRATVWALALAAAGTGAKLLVDALTRRPTDWGLLAHRRLRPLFASRTWLGAVCVALALGLTADAVRPGLLPATGDISLLVDEGQVSVVIPLEGDGVASCSLAAGTWSDEWSSPDVDPDWGDLGRSSAFMATRGTFQVLGQRDGGLVEGRYEGGRWHGEYVVTVADRLVTSARGRPAYLEHVDPEARRWYLALVPDTEGGVRLYWRYGDWLGRSARIERRLGAVDSVTAVDGDEDGLLTVLRVGDRLLWLTKPPETVPGDFGQEWTRAEEVRTGSGAVVRVEGDPALVRAVALEASDAPLYVIAVQAVDGLSVLTSTDFASNRWTAERLPVSGSTSSVAVTDATVDGRPSLLVAFRVGEVVYATHRSGGSWHRPVPIRCVG